ncbi:uncharacterized protein LOC135837307 [Planococcus citri]|uniref:uncharacterized protein LOC135837307 n=1 Tax=Planococcus citri TaxID=170843 RepID=UPI0031F87653
MMRHSSALLTILIAYSAYSFGVMIPYENNTVLHYSLKENISVTCSGTDEVTWRNTITLSRNYTINAETPYRKLLQIKNASVYNAGIFECVSKKHRDEFMRILIFPDASCYPDKGANPIYTIPIPNLG